MKPTNIIIEELASSIAKNGSDTENENDQNLELYESIINGRGQNFLTTRFYIKNDDLNPEEQVRF